MVLRKKSDIISEGGTGEFGELSTEDIGTVFIDTYHFLGNGYVYFQCSLATHGGYPAPVGAPPVLGSSAALLTSPAVFIAGSSPG